MMFNMRLTSFASLPLALVFGTPALAVPQGSSAPVPATINTILWGPQSGTTQYPGDRFGSNTITLPTFGLWNASNLSVFGSPYGWGNAATVLCVQAFQPSMSPCPVTGGASQPNGYATYAGRDVVNFVPTIYSPSARFQQTPAQVIAPQAGTFTATAFTPATPFTAGQMASLAFRQQLKSSDGCTATLNNWKTDGSILYVNGWYCSGALSMPAGTSAEVDADPAALAGGFSSATTFSFTTALNATQRGQLRAGMSLDSDDNPQCSGVLTTWDSDGGTWVQASGGFFQQTNGASCTPAGTHLVVGDIKKIFVANPVMNLYPYSRAYQMAEEHDCNNNQTPWITGATLALSQPANWCVDIISMGSYAIQYGLVFRGSGQASGKAYFDGIKFMSGVHDAVLSVNPTLGQSVPIVLSTQSANSGANTIGEVIRDWGQDGTIWARLKALTGVWELGNEGAATSSPGLKFYSSGSNAGIEDSSIIASAGSGGGATGTITANAASVKVNNGSGQYLQLSPGAAPLIASSGTIVMSPGNYGTAFAVNATPSMVNGVRVVPGTTGNAPIIKPVAGDANVSLSLQSIGTGGVIAQPGSDSAAAFKVMNAAGAATYFTVDTSHGVTTVNGDFYTSGTTPTVSSCGASPAISGTDVSGLVTIGSGAVTSCTINFHAALPNAPHGVVLTPANATAASWNATGAYISAVSSSAWIAQGAALAGAAYYYHVE
jgi:hypothetical protein